MPAHLPRLIGMVHLQPLPGAPHFEGDFAAVIDRACTDASTLSDAGFEGLMIENFGDAPFFAEAVPPVTVAAITRCAAAVRSVTSLPIGINVLRNDAVAALSIAAATDADYIRVNVLAGTMFTDQGSITGRAAELTRLRAALGAEVAIMADVFVKHAVPPAGLTLEDAAEELVGRGGADAVIASGSGTGKAAVMDHVKRIKVAIGDVPLYLGSGVTAASARTYLDVADGLIVGSATKPNGDVDAAVDPALARAIVQASG